VTGETAAWSLSLLFAHYLEHCGTHQAGRVYDCGLQQCGRWGGEACTFVRFITGVGVAVIYGAVAPRKNSGARTALVVFIDIQYSLYHHPIQVLSPCVT
jgi:hypothetical protein